ncbi:MAG: hypothetical protein ACXWT3_00910 [Methylococcaceae bacterium]
MFVLFLHGAVPFMAMPTLPQALWSTGFSQSFMNDSLFSIHATNFGIPKPAAISFGLAGAWPTALFMFIGLHASDAYSAMCAFWLSIAFFAAYRIALLLGLRAALAIGAAVLWMSMPVIGQHAVYSMLSLGIGLLSFYFLAPMRLFLQKTETRKGGIVTGAFYLFVCVLSVFMDSYSFMMFAVGSSILGVYIFSHFTDLRRQLLLFALPVHILGFGVAYLLYSVYIGKPQFESSPMDFFRGWGADLIFFVRPTQGIHWLPDILGWSAPRSSLEFSGDASVWITTFSIPIIVLGLYGWWRTQSSVKIAGGFLLVALFGFYMSLGPSLKVNSIKPTGLQIGDLMPAKLAFMPTGSALLSKHLPGFNNMRASYRWIGLGVFGLWCLTIMLFSLMKDRRGSVEILLGVLIFLNLPHLDRKWRENMHSRNMFYEIDRDLLADMKTKLHPGEKVAFLPFRNDFLINYLAANLDVLSYNIGGDKNLADARTSWPRTVRQFVMGQVDAGFTDRIFQLFAAHEADVVVLPYIDMLWAAHAWPAKTLFKEDMKLTARELQASGLVDIEERELFAVFRVKPQFKAQFPLRELERLMLQNPRLIAVGNLYKHGLKLADQLS